MKALIVQHAIMILILLSLHSVPVLAQQTSTLEKRVATLERKVAELEILVKRIAKKSGEEVDPVASNKDAIINDLNNLFALAYQHRIRPKAMGGGEGSYIGFEIRSVFRKNENASYTATNIKSNSVTFTGVSTKGYGNIITTIDDTGRPVSWKYTGKFKTD